nr:hypothetical protein [Tanacetum cinerariifolium]
MRGYEAYEQFLAMSNQEAGGSGSGIKRTCAYIPRDREEAEQRLLDDYFGDDETTPKYPKENFRRMYRMSSTLFAQIVNDITSYDAQRLPEYFHFLDNVTMLSVVLTFTIARDEKTLRFKRVQESGRKDIERAFGVLQVLHNMILQSEKSELSNFKDMFITS